MASKQYARAIYWRARPGQFDAYTRYLQTQVENIDHEARQRGALASFSTLVDNTPDAPWTHMRLFIFDSAPQRAQMVEALGQAASALTPDPDQRASRAIYAASLRDKVGEADFDVLGPAEGAG